MILNPGQVGWDTMPLDVDPAIYKRLLVTWPGARTIDTPAGVTQLVYQTHAAWPKESSIHDAIIYGVAERVSDIASFWRLLYKVMAHGGIVRVYSPYWTHIDVASDPTRLRGLSERHLAYLSAVGRAHLATDPYDDGVAINCYKDIDFDTIALGHFSEPEWEARSEADRNRALTHLINISRRIEATLKVYKPVRSPEVT